MTITAPSSTQPWQDDIDYDELDPKELMTFIIYENGRRATLRGINPVTSEPFRTKRAALDALAECAKTRPLSLSERRERQLMLISLDYLLREVPAPTLDVLV